MQENPSVQIREMEDLPYPTVLWVWDLVGRGVKSAPLSAVYPSK